MEGGRFRVECEVCGSGRIPYYCVHIETVVIGCVKYGICGGNYRLLQSVSVARRVGYGFNGRRISGKY